MFSLTERAKEKIKQIIKEEGGDYYLRVYAIPSGCCGLDFGMELTRETEITDTFIDFDDFKAVVDDFSFPFLENIIIDITEKEGETFFILNTIKTSCCSSMECNCSSANENENYICSCGKESCNCN